MTINIHSFGELYKYVSPHDCYKHESKQWDITSQPSSALGFWDEITCYVNVNRCCLCVCVCFSDGCSRTEVWNLYHSITWWESWRYCGLGLCVCGWACLCECSSHTSVKCHCLTIYWINYESSVQNKSGQISINSHLS